MNNLILLLIEDENSLLNLDNIIKFNKKVKAYKKTIKILLISNKNKVELGTFIDIFNNLIGLDIIDFAISTSSGNIVYIEKAKELKNHNIKNRNITNLNCMVHLLIDSYRSHYNLDNIYYIANNDDLFNILEIKNINYKEIEESLYNTIFELKED